MAISATKAKPPTEPPTIAPIGRGASGDDEGCITITAVDVWTAVFPVVDVDCAVEDDVEDDDVLELEALLEDVSLLVDGDELVLDDAACANPVNDENTRPSCPEKVV